MWVPVLSGVASTEPCESYSQTGPIAKTRREAATKAAKKRRCCTCWDGAAYGNSIYKDSVSGCASAGDATDDVGDAGPVIEDDSDET